jgi:hypothetical protein
MTEAEWLACTDPWTMLVFLQPKASERKLRLFACACCRTAWQRLKDKRSKEAIEVAERYADGLEDKLSLGAARRHAIEAANVLRAVPGLRRHRKTKLLALAAGRAVSDGWDTLAWGGIEAGEQHASWIVRDIFGDSFRLAPPVPPAVLAWNGDTVRRIAQVIYEEPRMPEGTLDNARLAILADALLVAGCDNEELIQHCRSEGPHVRGCWALDLILGKS